VELLLGLGLSILTFASLNANLKLRIQCAALGLKIERRPEIQDGVSIKIKEKATGYALSHHIPIF
jgi:hypothetical protein